MRIACISFSNSGNKLGDKLVEILIEKYEIEHYKNKYIKETVSEFLRENWNNYEGFIFISATGIAVRYINPFIRDKTMDPAIVVIDDLGRFVISLLSGHLGGANELSNYIAKKINGISVITTATDSRGIESVDMFGKRNDYFLDNMEDVKDITAIMVNGGRIGFYSEENSIIDYEKIYKVDELNELNEIDKKLDGVIIVSNKKYIKKLNDLDIKKVILRPKNINIGIGCKKGKSGKEIIEFIEKSLNSLNISSYSLNTIGTIELKKDETGIIEAAKFFNIPLRTFSAEDIIKVEDKFIKSEFVKKTVGVYSVSEPTAYLLGKKMLLQKSICNGITISVSEGEFYE